MQSRRYFTVVQQCTKWVDSALNAFRGTWFIQCLWSILDPDRAIESCFYSLAFWHSTRVVGWLCLIWSSGPSCATCGGDDGGPCTFPLQQAQRFALKSYWWSHTFVSEIMYRSDKCLTEVTLLCRKNYRKGTIPYVVRILFHAIVRILLFIQTLNCLWIDWPPHTLNNPRNPFELCRADWLPSVSTSASISDSITVLDYKYLSARVHQPSCTTKCDGVLA